MNVPRLVIAGLSGDSGKTLISLSLVRALREREAAVSVFKKGPDYIDAAWLSWAAGRPCRNLDTYLANADDVRANFVRAASDTDIAVIEGNRGLFDGMDATGTHSTAELATLLQAPVVLVVNATKVTRTVAALINGIQSFDPRLDVAGVILNRVAGGRHEQVIREAIASYCGLPVLGVVPRQTSSGDLLPSRHLGLVPVAERASESEMDHRLAQLGASYLDITALQSVARNADALDVRVPHPLAANQPSVRIGYFHDTVFTFYYPENLEALELAGAEMVSIDALHDTSLPPIDALYIGGGFPEVHADRLRRNRALMDAVRRAAEDGMPVYAECGGLIYLAASITYDNRRYLMSGVFDIDLTMSRKPAGHGYSQMSIDRENPFFAIGTTVRGHEFHYSSPDCDFGDADTCMAVSRGVGVGKRRDGFVCHNVLACYSHLHALGTPGWAPAVVQAAQRYRDRSETGGRSATTTSARPEMMAMRK